MVVIIILLFVIIAAIADGIIDTLKFHYYISSLPKTNWWDTKYSWTNKWERTTSGGIIINTETKWYYLWLYKPRYKEKFIYSSTILAWTTDAFHFFKSIKLNSLFLALVIAFDYTLILSLIAFFSIRIIYGLVFELLFNSVLLKNNI